MGDHAEPLKLKVLKGRGPGRDGRPRDSGGRVLPPPPNFKRIAPDKPKSLGKHANEEWDRVVPQLERLGYLTPAHLGGLVSMCEAWERCELSRKDIRRRGILVKTAEGLRRNPALMALRAAEQEYRAWCIQFGLTPSAEGHLKPQEADLDQDNPIAGG